MYQHARCPSPDRSRPPLLGQCPKCHYYLQEDCVEGDDYEEQLVGRFGTLGLDDVLLDEDDDLNDEDLWPGDSSPYPQVTREELDIELEAIARRRAENIHQWVDDMSPRDSTLCPTIIKKELDSELDDLCDEELWPGDSSPYPRVTREELDNELDEIALRRAQWITV